MGAAESRQNEQSKSIAGDKPNGGDFEGIIRRFDRILSDDATNFGTRSKGPAQPPDEIKIAGLRDAIKKSNADKKALRKIGEAALTEAAKKEEEAAATKQKAEAAIREAEVANQKAEAAIREAEEERQKAEAERQKAAAATQEAADRAAKAEAERRKAKAERQKAAAEVEAVRRERAAAERQAAEPQVMTPPHTQHNQQYMFVPSRGPDHRRYTPVTLHLELPLDGTQDSDSDDRATSAQPRKQVISKGKESPKHRNLNSTEATEKVVEPAIGIFETITKHFPFMNTVLRYLGVYYIQMLIWGVLGLVSPGIEETVFSSHKLREFKPEMRGVATALVMTIGTRTFLDKEKVEVIISTVLILVLILIMPTCFHYCQILFDMARNAKESSDVPTLVPTFNPTSNPTLTPTPSPTGLIPVRVPPSKDTALVTEGYCDRVIEKLITELGKMIRNDSKSMSSFVTEVMCKSLTAPLKGSIDCVCGKNDFLRDAVKRGLSDYFHKYVPVMWSLLSAETISAMLTSQRGENMTFNGFMVGNKKLDTILIRNGNSDKDGTIKDVLKLISYINNNQDKLPDVDGVNLKSRDIYLTSGFTQRVLWHMFGDAGDVSESRAKRILRGEETAMDKDPPLLQSIINYMKKHPSAPTNQDTETLMKILKDHETELRRRIIR
jgi:hypothetical protein